MRRNGDSRDKKHDAETKKKKKRNIGLMAWFFNFKLRQFTRVCNQKRQIYQFLSRSSGVTEAFGGRMRKYDEINKYWQIHREALPIEEANTNLAQSVDLKCFYSGSTPVLTDNLNALFKLTACLLVPAPLPCKIRYDLLMLITSKSVEPIFRRCALQEQIWLFERGAAKSLFITGCWAAAGTKEHV